MSKSQLIGKMTYRIAFMTFLTGRDEFNGTVKTWLTSNEIYAAVEFKEVGSTEDFIADRSTGLTNTVFRIYSREGLQTYMRVLYNGDQYEITAILPQTDKRYTLVHAIRTEPEQRITYITTATGLIWVDPENKPWEWIGDGGGANEPTKKPYISPGGLTWTDTDGNTWYKNPSS